MKRGYGFSGRSVETRNTSNSVRDRLVRHMRDPSGDSTLNDSVVGDLFREDHGIEEGVETDLESVEAWAVDLLMKKGN